MPIFALILCLPLLLSLLTERDETLRDLNTGDLILIMVIAILPAISILLASKLEKTRAFLFVLLVIILFTQLIIGVTPTGYSRDGTDILFIYLNILHFLIATIIISILYIAKFIKIIYKRTLSK
jgi:hypothetical protein